MLCKYSTINNLHFVAHDFCEHRLHMVPQLRYLGLCCWSKLFLCWKLNLIYNSLNSLTHFHAYLRESDGKVQVGVKTWGVSARQEHIISNKADSSPFTVHTTPEIFSGHGYKQKQKCDCVFYIIIFSLELNICTKTFLRTFAII